MAILGTIIIGFIVGLLARAILPGKQSLGLILTTVLGVAGAFVASYGGQALGLYQPGQPAGFIGAIVGAMVLLFAYGMVAGKS